MSFYVPKRTNVNSRFAAIATFFTCDNYLNINLKIYHLCGTDEIRKAGNLRMTRVLVIE